MSQLLDVKARCVGRLENKYLYNIRMLYVDEHTPQKTIARFYMFSIFYPKTL